MHSDYSGQGVDQLAQVIHTIKTNPNDRRIIMSAWNPVGKGSSRVLVFSNYSQNSGVATDFGSGTIGVIGGNFSKEPNKKRALDVTNV